MGMQSMHFVFAEITEFQIENFYELIFIVKFFCEIEKKNRKGGFIFKV